MTHIAQSSYSLLEQSLLTRDDARSLQFFTWTSVSGTLRFKVASCAVTSVTNKVILNNCSLWLMHPVKFVFLLFIYFCVRNLVDIAPTGGDMLLFNSRTVYHQGSQSVTDFHFARISNRTNAVLYFFRFRIIKYLKYFNWVIETRYTLWPFTRPAFSLVVLPVQSESPRYALTAWLLGCSAVLWLILLERLQQTNVFAGPATLPV